MDDKKTLAVLIPAYNEELTIGDTIDDFYNVLKDNNRFKDYIIYAYDNLSTDNTAKIIKEKAKYNRHISFGWFDVQGKGAIVREMFREIDADIYVIADADMTYPAHQIYNLTDMVERGFDLVNGDRLSTTYKMENKRLFHNLGNGLIKNLINKLWKTNIPDILTGYRAFSKRFVKTFASYSMGFEIETEITVFALENHYNIHDVPIDYKDRPEYSSSKINTFTDGLKIMKLLFNFFRVNKPLIFFTFLSLFFFIIGLIPFVVVLFEFWETGNVDKIPTLIASCFVFLASILSFFSGLILDAVRINQRNSIEILMKQKY